jgi:hypothetical protein
MLQHTASPRPETAAAAARHAPGISVAFWCERVTYGPRDVLGTADVLRHAVGTPAEAMRQIRQAVHARASALPPIERNRALSWTDDGGAQSAAAALHRREPCAFSLSHQDSWIEWSVHPFLVFDVSTTALLPLAATPRCPRGVTQQRPEERRAVPGRPADPS